MARKKKNIVLSTPPEDLGVKQYGFVQGGKKGINEKTGERKKTWRSPAAIYLFVVAAFLVFWFFYSFIGALIEGGAQVVLDYLGSLFALAVCLLIIFMSVFKLWAKFARFALNRGLVKDNERAEVEQSMEMMETCYEKMDKPVPVFEVYENYICATDGEEVKIFDRAGIEKIAAYKSDGLYSIAIISGGAEFIYEFVWLHGLNLPVREVKKLKDYFGEKLQIEPLYGSEDKKERIKSKLSDLREEFDGGHVAGLVMGLIAAAAGGGVLALHYKVDESIPFALGLFFIIGGVLVVFTAFDFVPIVKVFIIPLFFGCLFAVIPIQFCFIIADDGLIEFAFSGAHEFFSSFCALFCAVAFLEAMGVLITVSAFWGLIKYIKYGEH